MNKVSECIILHIPEATMIEAEKTMLKIRCVWFDGSVRDVKFSRWHYKVLKVLEDGTHIVALPIWVFQVNYFDYKEIVDYKIHGRKWL